MWRNKESICVMLLFITVGHHLIDANGTNDGQGQTQPTQPAAAVEQAPPMPPDPPGLKQFGISANVAQYMTDGHRTTDYPAEGVKPRKTDPNKLNGEYKGNTEKVELPPMYIAGTYEIAGKTPVDMYTELPSLATYWRSVSSDFRLVIWPPKYCHGVYVCFLDTAAYSTHVKFHVKKDLCAKKAFKFYPWLRKVEFFPADGSAEKAVSQESSTFFEITSTSVTAYLREKEEVAGTKYFDETNNPMKSKSFTIDRTQDVVLLTNSRLCHAHLSGRQSMQYVPLLDGAAYKAKTDFPAADIDHVENRFYPVSGAPQTTSDVLEVLKGREFAETGMIGRQEKKCSAHFESGADDVRPIYSTATQMSILVKHVSLNTDQATKKSHAFSISVSRCSWLRVWLPWGFKDIKDYKDDFKVEQTVDFFFDQAFMITPQSGGAIPLPGNSESVKMIKFEFMNQAAGTMKVSYGYNGKDYSYREYIHLHGPINDSANGYKSKMSIYMIRSEYCDAEIVSEQVKKGRNIFDDGDGRTEMLSLAQNGCYYGIIKE